MADHPNAARVRSTYEAFARGDMATLADVFAEDMVWHFPGNHPLAGDHKGRDAVFSILAKSGEMSGGTFNIELHDVLANDDHAVAIQLETGSRGGKQLNQLDVEVFHMKDGKITEWWSFAGDQRGEDAFWS